MIDAQQLLDYIIRPTLKHLDLDSEDAERQVLGTPCQETQCGRYLRQIGGPALGIYQMEPATHDDLWLNFLVNQPVLGPKVRKLAAGLVLEAAEEMIGNLCYATAMCRIKYYRDPAPIPSSLREQAEYWKRIYNTPAGAGTVEQYIANWQRYAGAVRF